MSLTELTADLAVHQKLSDEPNDVGGLSAQELKAKFDEAGLTIQSYLNGTHIPEVEEALRESLAQARDYTDRKVVAVGAGDMASVLYDSQKRRQDVYQYAHDEAVRVLGPAARFGYVAMGAATGTSRNGTPGMVTFLPGQYADPRDFWKEELGAFVVPQGACAMGLTLSLRWGRQEYNLCTVELLVNGRAAASITGPEAATGVFQYDTVMLAGAVQGGDRVQVRLLTKGESTAIGGGSLGEVKVFSLRAEILM